MVPSQLEKLKKDSRELEYAIARMQKEGRSDRVGQFQLKKAQVDAFINKAQEYAYHWNEVINISAGTSVPVRISRT